MSHYDNAAASQPKHFIPLMPHQSRKLVNGQAATADYRLGYEETDDDLRTRKDEKAFHSNNELWEAIFVEQLKPYSRLHLENFFLFEWFPRSPGLYHTPDGRRSREQAQHNIESVENGIVVYNPYGKMSMLDGGVGNLRLKPISLHDQEFFLMSASSNGSCHQGFPIAFPAHSYNQHIDEITDRGCVALSLRGTLRFLPDRFSEIYKTYKEVPELFLLVDEIQSSPQRKSRSLEDLSASVAVSFLSEYEGRPKVYATYVNFRPGDKHSFRDHIEWLEDKYVKQKYHGRIITDFDEQRGHFTNAPFSLNKVMGLNLDFSEITKIADDISIDSMQLLGRQDEIRIQIGELYMAPKYKITGGQQGAVGDHAKAENFVQVWNNVAEQIDLEKLKAELNQLRTEARSQAKSPNEDIIVSELANAEIAASQDDGPKVLRHLANAGKWALDLATKIGTNVAAAAIKQSIGLA